MTTTTDNDSSTMRGASSGGRVRGGAGAATGKIGGAIGGAKNRAAEAYSATRERTSDALSSGRESAAYVTRRASERIETNPIIAVAGGLAVGAILAAVLPRTRREQETFGQVGHKVTDVARDAANSAVEAGRQQVNELTTNAMAKVGSAVVDAVVSGETAGAQQKR